MCMIMPLPKKLGSSYKAICSFIIISGCTKL